MKTKTAALATVSLVLIPASAAQAAETDQRPALDVLDEITVAEDHHMDDYDRDAFAPDGWVDANGTGCTTREDILARDLDEDTLSLDGCTVEYGTTTGAYSAAEIEHAQGDSQVDIEHVVAIGQAHRNGAHEWDEDTMEEFYQDPENLIAASSSENQSKGARDVTEYMPPNQGAYCEFAAATVYIKDKYDLAMNPDEHTVISDVLQDPECENTPAAPAQALYTSDWDAEPTATNTNTDNPISDLLENTNPWILAGIAALVLIVIATLIASPRARRSLGRAAKRSARRAARRGTRSAFRQ